MIDDVRGLHHCKWMNNLDTKQIMLFKKLLISPSKLSAAKNQLI